MSALIWYKHAVKTSTCSIYVRDGKYISTYIFRHPIPFWLVGVNIYRHAKSAGPLPTYHYHIRIELLTGDQHLPHLAYLVSGSLFPTSLQTQTYIIMFLFQLNEKKKEKPRQDKHISDFLWMAGKLH